MIVTSNKGLSGIVTCDVVVDATGNAVDCSSVWNFFNSACWNPLAPCAAQGSTLGQSASMDCSQSQLGPLLCNLFEAPANSNNTFGGVSFMGWLLLIGGVVVLKDVL